MPVAMSDESAPPLFGALPRTSGPRARDVKAWVREAARVPEDATVLVTELSCSEPGCPPYEVVMAILAEGAPPLQKKLHKRLADLSRDEVVALWSGQADDRDDHHHRSEMAPKQEE
jgi:hypothetical protein